MVKQELDGTQHQLFMHKGIVGIFLLAEGFALIVVQYPHRHIEAAAHLHQPLVNQGIRHQDHDATDFTADKKLMGNQAGFDGFTQAHFIGQHDPRLGMAGNGLGDVELVGDGVHPGAHKTFSGMLVIAG